jgi:DNA processing protein
MCHEASLRHSVPATIVIAGGLHHPSPAGSRAAFERIVREGGAVVTDRPPTCRPHRRDFVRRNALIAAIADVVVVAAAPDKSGALETARVARRLGVPVLAVPGMFDDPSFAGAHQLLRDGAGLCTEPDDVARALGAQPNLAFAPQARGPSVSPPAAHLLALLRDGQTVDELVRAGQFTLAEAHELLLELELEGVLAG